MTAGTFCRPARATSPSRWRRPTTSPGPAPWPRTRVLVVPVRIVVPAFQAAIDAGSKRTHIDALGDTWQPDQAFTAGSSGYLGSSSTVSTSKPIAGTGDAARLADAREGMYEYRF